MCVCVGGGVVFAKHSELKLKSKSVFHLPRMVRICIFSQRSVMRAYECFSKRYVAFIFHARMHHRAWYRGASHTIQPVVGVMDASTQRKYSHTGSLASKFKENGIKGVRQSSCFNGHICSTLK